MDQKSAIKEYWEKEVCGSRYGVSRDKAEWFKEIERSRYRLEPYIPSFADFEAYKGKRVLEIGLGAGTDFVNWQRNQARAVGVDISEESVKITRQRLVLEGADPGFCNVCVADAENLPFKENAFEMVYAWGSLHHTPDIKKALKEIRRVLKPQGKMKAMIYHIPSWTGWMLWLRFCLFRLRPWDSVSKAIFEHLESPGTKAFTLTQAKEMLARANFSDIETQLKLGPGDKLLIKPGKRYQALFYKFIWLIYPRWLVSLLGNNFGLNLFIKARKGL